MLEIRNLNAFYGDSHILHDISLTLGDGARVAILGRNGAGKSTLLKSISNAGPIAGGSISWNGKNVSGIPSHRRAQMGFSFVPEDRRILGSLTVFENLRMAYTGTPVERRTATPQQVLEQFPLLVPLRNREGGFLSGGQQQLLAVARAAISNPSLLLLDEPTEGLAPVIVEELARHVIRICNESRATLLVCEQSIWFSRKCTDNVHIIDSGKLVFSGTWQDLDEKPEVRNRHLAVA